MSICHICDGRDLITIIERENMPRSGQFLLSVRDKFATATLKWEGCRSCGALTLDQSRLGSVDYTHVVRGTQSQLPAYKGELVRMVQAALQNAGGGKVVEVGANDGTFLKLLLQNGISDLFAVEPSVAFNSDFEDAKIAYLNRHLTIDTARDIRSQIGPVAMVICRHTLEHVPQPLEFLQSIRELLDGGDGVALIEVPDTKSLMAHTALHELWDEHLYYYSEASLRALLARSGLAVHEVRRYPHLDSEHLLMLVGRSAGKQKAAAIIPDVDPVQLSRNIDVLLNSIRNEGVRWKKPVAALGAAHPQSNFLSLSGAARFVDKLVDDDPVKVGRFVPVLGHAPLPVVSTQVFLQSASDTLLLTGFGYPGWVKRIRDQGDRRLTFVEPYGAVDAGKG